MSSSPVPPCPESGPRVSIASPAPLSAPKRGVLPLQHESARGWLRNLTIQTGFAMVLGALAVAATRTTTADPVARSGHVTGKSGAAAVEVGDACEVHIDPETKAGLNCRVTVTCKGYDLFGGQRLGGYADCGVEDGEYHSAVDALPSTKDGDPTVAVDLRKGLARVSDDAKTYEVEIALKH
jgi:hypothetical protein